MMKKPYKLLPFRFQRKDNQVLMANDVGEFYFLHEPEFHSLVHQEMETNSQAFFDLQSKFFVYTDTLAPIIQSLAIRYRTKKRFLYDFTSLHMFVVTQRCNQKCRYCHASSVDESGGHDFDMDIETARKCVELAFDSPSSNIKIEFQGGEPLLNFSTVKEIVSYSKKLNEIRLKNIEFVICTNLIGIKDEHLDFIKENGLCISTSLDGPPDIHDTCRITRSGKGTYEMVAENMARVMSAIGPDKVSALMTITPYNIKKLPNVIDEYFKRGLSSIFLRAINPYGLAAKNWPELGYSVDEFIENYQTALKYIIELNLSGRHFVEQYATLLLTRILTPFSTGFVDLQSPAGAGISGAIYETNGDVFIADEGRMLEKMTGDKVFCLGNVYHDDWKSMFCGKKLIEIIDKNCIESIPGCAWCVYQTYCGSDPIRNYMQFGGFSMKNIESDFCNKVRSILDILFVYLEKDDERINDLFWSWINGENLSDPQIPFTYVN